MRARDTPDSLKYFIKLYVVHTSANMEHAAAVVQTGVRHNMTFVDMEMYGLGKSMEDYRYSHRRL